jgi:pyridoxal biosynthesis lyase PdxS
VTAPRRILFPAGASGAAIRTALEAICAEEPGAIATMTLRHALACPKRAGGACRCEPEVFAYVVQDPVNA